MQGVGAFPYFSRLSRRNRWISRYQTAGVRRSWECAPSPLAPTRRSRAVQQKRGKRAFSARCADVLARQTKKPRPEIFHFRRGFSPVDAGGLKPNTWQRFERLSSAWNQAKLGIDEEPEAAADGETGVVANPRRRARTPLTESQVDAIRTARLNDESVVSICRRFGIHRMTVWTYTKDMLG